MKLEKRYQFFTSHGKEWTKWFPFRGERVKWQMKGKLLNQYREK